MSRYIQNFLKFQPLLVELVARDIKIKYRRSVLGVLWTLLNPLCMMVILSIVFSNLFKFDIENFPLYVLSGQVVFNFFNDSTTSAMSSIIGSASLIKKVYVPKYLFVISRVLSSFINLMASFTALILVIFSLGVGLLLSALAVKFRDVIHLYSVFTTGLMYLMPVIYPMSMLPDKIKTIVLMNPLTNMLQMFRDSMLNGKGISFTSFLTGSTEALVMLIIGLYIFYKCQDEFILEI